MKFTSCDRDNDQRQNNNCASYSGGGWWHHNCANIHLNIKENHVTMRLNGQWLVTSSIQMNIRPKDCNTD